LCGRSNSLLDQESFWNWPYFSTYLQFIGALCTVLAALTLAFVRQTWFVQMIGTVALGIEATLALPQAYANYKNQSAEGLNLILIATWFAGDAFKTFVFISEAAPFQFIACGTFQLLVDCVVLAQLAMYRSGPSPKSQF
jgi:urea transporter